MTTMNPSPASPSPSGLRSWVDQVIDFGVEANPGQAVRQIRIGNVIALVGIVVQIAYAVVVGWIGQSLAAFVLVLGLAGLYLLNFYLVRKGELMGARASIQLVFMGSTLVGIAIGVPPESGVPTYLLVVPPLAIYLFGPQHRRWAYGYSVLAVLVGFACERMPPIVTLVTIPEAYLDYLRLAVFPVCALILVFVGVVYEKEILDRETALLKASLTDPLTGIPNRRAVFEKAIAFHRQARQAHDPLTVMLIDIDFFKRINDTHGHATGDQVLIQFSNLLLTSLRPTDAFGRIGGEEFFVAMPRTALGEGLAVAEKVRGSVEAQSLRTDGGEVLRYTISLGVSAAKADDLSFDALVARADGALYEAKRSGRNKCVSD